jgi:hypothetical protein
MQVIPLTSSPNQTFQVALIVNGINLTLGFFLSYNELAGYWSMRISDPRTNTIILDSVPLVESNTNLLSQYEYLRIGNAYLVKAEQADSDYPDDSNLGTTFQLVWGDNLDYYEAETVESALDIIDGLTAQGRSAGIVRLKGEKGDPGIGGSTDYIAIAIGLAAQAAASALEAKNAADDITEYVEANLIEIVITSSPNVIGDLNSLFDGNVASGGVTVV